MDKIFLLLDHNRDANETRVLVFTSVDKAKKYALDIENGLASYTEQERLAGLSWQLAWDGSFQTLEGETYSGSQYTIEKAIVDPA